MTKPKSPVDRGPLADEDITFDDGATFSDGATFTQEPAKPAETENSRQKPEA